MGRRRRLQVSPEASFWTMIVVLFGLSAFFIINVEMRRRQMGLGKKVRVVNGASVELVKVIDGDEVSVRSAGSTVVVRLLGIKCFGSTAHDPQLGAAGKACARALEKRLAAGMKVEYATFKTDKAKRVLAYLRADGKDIGLGLVAEGLAMVYTRYPFERQKSYLAAERKARRESLGIWSNPTAAMRATALKAVWEAER